MASGYACSWLMAYLGLAVTNSEAIQAAIYMVVFPITLTSSVFLPTQTMPGWLQAFAEHQPITIVGYRRTIGFVFQRYHLLPALTALDNVVAPLLPYRVRFSKAQRGRELLAAVGLSGRESALPTNRPAIWTRVPALRSSTYCSNCANATA